MKISKVLASAAIIVSLAAGTAFAATGPSVSNGPAAVTETRQHAGKDWKQKHEEFLKDPVKALESKKEKVQSLLKDGKITKEKAQKITARIDAQIKEIQSFNKLTVEQKKEKLISNFNTMMEKRVKDGKMDQAKADTLKKSYAEKVNQWDGTGYPPFHAKMFKGNCKGHTEQ